MISDWSLHVCSQLQRTAWRETAAHVTQFVFESLDQIVLYLFLRSLKFENNTSGCPYYPLQDTYLRTVLRTDRVQSTSRTWSNLTPQPVHSTLHLPIGLLLPHCELNTPQNHDRFMSWLPNGGTSSPLTSGQQKACTSSATELTGKIYSVISCPAFLRRLTGVGNCSGAWEFDSYMKKTSTVKLNNENSVNFQPWVAPRSICVGAFMCTNFGTRR